MKAFLLDVNVLIALAWDKHVHHNAAIRWFNAHRQFGWATCTITQLGFVRLSANPRVVFDARLPIHCRESLEQLLRLPNHQFWQEPADGIFTPTFDYFLERIQAHNQVTDAYLVGLAAAHGGKVATFDKGLYGLFPEHVELIDG